jgi:hypothetical protein
MNHEILIQEFAENVLSVSKLLTDPISAYWAVKALKKLQRRLRLENEYC